MLTLCFCIDGDACRVRSVTPGVFTAFEELVGEAATTAPRGINMTRDVLAVGEGAVTDPFWYSSPASTETVVAHFSSYDAVLVPTVKHLPPHVIKALRASLDGGTKVVMLGGQYKDAAYVKMKTKMKMNEVPGCVPTGSLASGRLVEADGGLHPLSPFAGFKLDCRSLVSPTCVLQHDAAVSPACAGRCFCRC